MFEKLNVKEITGNKLELNLSSLIETDRERVPHHRVTCHHVASHFLLMRHQYFGIDSTTMEIERLSWGSDGDWCLDYLQNHQEVLSML